MLSETSLLNFSIGHTDVSFDETSNDNYSDYTYDNLQLSYTWLFSENHRIGLTGTYSEFDSPESDFSYDQTVLSLDYTYTINETSNISMSVGSRQLDSLAEDVTVGCEVEGFVDPVPLDPNTGECPIPSFFGPTPIIEDITQKNDGTVVNLAYSNQYQRSSFRLDMSRSVIPSSFGSAQEEKRAELFANHALTERLNSDIKFSASETRTLDGGNSINDRDRMQLSMSLVYKLSKDTNLSLLYNYVEQTLIETEQDSASNALMINLYMGWPRLATTY
jgi:predicted porin